MLDTWSQFTMVRRNSEELIDKKALNSTEALIHDSLSGFLLGYAPYCLAG